MSKTLTEQWREGTLPDGYYYITSKKWGMLIDRYRDHINDCGDEWRGFDNCQGIADEVLAPVPSYDEYKELLDLNVYEKDRKKVMGLEDKVKRLQEQIKEADELIKDYVHDANDCFTMGRIRKYLEKWGVK